MITVWGNDILGGNVMPQFKHVKCLVILNLSVVSQITNVFKSETGALA